MSANFELNITIEVKFCMKFNITFTRANCTHFNLTKYKTTKLNMKLHFHLSLFFYFVSTCFMPSPYRGLFMFTTSIFVTTISHLLLPGFLLSQILRKEYHRTICEWKWMSFQANNRYLPSSTDIKEQRIFVSCHFS